MRTVRQRTVDEARDSQFPGFRRVDVHLWSRAKFYPGAVFVLVPRMFAAFIGLALSYVTQGLLYFGVSKEVPLSGVRRWLWLKHMDFITSVFLRVLGYHPEFVYYSRKDIEQNYAKYLGKDWIKEQDKEMEARRKRGFKRSSTIVVNHIGFIDELLLLNQSNLKPSFTPARFVKDLPIANLFIECLQGIYIDRDLPLS